MASGGAAEGRENSCTKATESGEGSGDLIDVVFLYPTESRYPKDNERCKEESNQK